MSLPSSARRQTRTNSWRSTGPSRCTRTAWYWCSPAQAATCTLASRGAARLAAGPARPDCAPSASSCAAGSASARAPARWGLPAETRAPRIRTDPSCTGTRANCTWSCNKRRTWTPASRSTRQGALPGRTTASPRSSGRCYSAASTCCWPPPWARSRRTRSAAPRGTVGRTLPPHRSKRSRSAVCCCRSAAFGSSPHRRRSRRCSRGILLLPASVAV